MTSGCCETVFRFPAPHDQQSFGEKELVFELYRGCPGPWLSSFVGFGWLKAKAKLCNVGSTQCGPESVAEIRIESFSSNGKHASGNYRVDLASFRRKEGMFAVKEHHKGKKIICE